MISFGNTVVFTCISQEIVEPNSERPNEGFLFFNVETSPFTSESYEPGKTTDQEHNLIYFLENMFKESSCLDLETLCITSGKQVNLNPNSNVLGLGFKGLCTCITR